MEFDKSRVYTALNADELKVGSKVILADSLDLLKEYVKEDFRPSIIEKVVGETFTSRFYDGEAQWNLAYLVEEPEEKKLKWTDLKIGDVVRQKNSGMKYMVTGIDSQDTTVHHIFFGTIWINDTYLEYNWEKVEE